MHLRQHVHELLGWSTSGSETGVTRQLELTSDMTLIRRVAHLQVGYLVYFRECIPATC